MGEMRRASRAGAAAAAAAWIVCAAELAIYAALRLADWYVLPTLVSYGPRWVWLVPPALLLPAALLLSARFRTPRVLVPLAAALLIVAGPIMQFEIGVRAASAPPAGLTVVSFNVQGEPLLGGRVLELIASEGADIVALQECPQDDARRLAEALGEPWRVSGRGGLCVASRYPLRETGLMDRRLFGGWGAIGTSYAIDAPGGPVSFFNVHLETVREGLEPVVTAGVAGFDALRRNLAFRDRESRLAAEWVATAPAPAIVAGDFNMASDSAIYRTHWRQWQNAFERAGFGYGYTKYTRWSGIRIDHVLYGDAFEAGAAAVGPDLGSDHRPVIATLRRTD